MQTLTIALFVVLGAAGAIAAAVLCGFVYATISEGQGVDQ